MRLLSSLCLSGVVATSQQGSSPLSQVVKMLETTLKDLIEERTLKEKSFEKTSCLTKKTTEQNNKLIQESEDSIDEMNNELSLLGSVSLTDESQVLAKKIDDKKKEVTALVAELDSMTTAHNTHMADLDAGVAALGDAESQIQGKSFLVQKKTLSRALADKKLTTRQHAYLQDFMEQAPAAYQSQVGAITELIVNLKTQYQKEQAAAKLTFKKAKKAQDAMIDEANVALDTLQAEFETGAGEAAAKQKRSDELNTAIGAANKAIATAKAQNKEMSDMQTLHTGEWQKFITDSANQEAAINKAIEILGNDEARSTFQTAEDHNSAFLQLGAVSTEGSAAIQTLRDAIKDMKAELEEEKDNIEASVRKCEKDANNLLETAKQKAEQMDGFAANIASLEKQIASEIEKQKKFTEEIAARKEERTEAIKVYNEEIADLDQIISDLRDADRIVKKGTQALEEYDYQSAGKSEIYHDDNKTSPLAGVITMLKNISSEMITKIEARKTEKQVATTEHNKYLSEVGDITPLEDKEDQFVDQINSPDTIIGDLEDERNASITAMNDAQKSLNGDTVSLQSNEAALFGPDKKSGVLGAYKEMQPGCDYWMITAPGRKVEIADEIAALLSADTILSNQDLGMASEDIAHLEAREKGADAKDHEFAHVGSS